MHLTTSFSSQVGGKGTLIDWNEQHEEETITHGLEEDFVRVDCLLLL